VRANRRVRNVENKRVKEEKTRGMHESKRVKEEKQKEWLTSPLGTCIPIWSII